MGRANEIRIEGDMSSMNEINLHFVFLYKSE